MPKPLSRLEETFALQCKSMTIDIQREYKFHPDRKWKFDFAIPEKMIAIEAEGGTWGKSRHTTARGFAEDCAKYNTSVFYGWRVFRFDGDAIKSGAALQFLCKYLASIK